MGTIGDIKSKMPPPGNFLTEEQREDLYRTSRPFFIKKINGDRTSKFTNKDGTPKKQWTLTCVMADGGDDWDLTMSKNSYRDLIMEPLQALLATDEFSLRGIGPVKLAKYKAGNGNMAWTIEDYEEPGQQAVPVSDGQVSTKCVSCGLTVAGVPILMGDDRFVAHDCKKDKKKVLLPVAK